MPKHSSVEKEDRSEHHFEFKMQQGIEGGEGGEQGWGRRGAEPLCTVLSSWGARQWSHISIGNITIVSTATNVMLQITEMSIFEEVGGKHKCGACRG